MSGSVSDSMIVSALVQVRPRTPSPLSLPPLSLPPLSPLSPRQPLPLSPLPVPPRFSLCICACMPVIATPCACCACCACMVECFVALASCVLVCVHVRVCRRGWGMRGAGGRLSGGRTIGGVCAQVLLVGDGLHGHHGHPGVPHVCRRCAVCVPYVCRMCAVCVFALGLGRGFTV